jgi:phage repressor protein C with HTH and peptisase S24 domain
MSSLGVSMEREYFSGSLVETKKTTARDDRAGVGGELGALRRSSSYNADR